MGKKYVYQLRTKVRFNPKIDKGFIFNCPSDFSDEPSAAEVRKALEDIAGKDASNFASMRDCEVLSKKW